MERRVAIVTGAGDGIGKGIVSSFLNSGYRVGSFDNLKSRLDACAAEFGGDCFFPCVADVMNEGSVNESVNLVLEKFGRIDVLVNNVGGSMGVASPLEEISLEDFEKVLIFNTRGTFLCSKAVIPIMKKQRHGRIINMSSMAGRSRSVFGGTPYTASKAAIIGFTHQASKDLAPHGITINAIAPGTMLGGERTRRYWEENRTEEERQAILATVPVGRMGTAEDIGRTAVFLADPGASFITGAVFDINGGAWVG